MVHRMFLGGQRQRVSEVRQGAAYAAKDPSELGAGRVLPDPAARSLLTIVAKNPKVALKALAA
jgi:hypothetical protein